MAQPARNNQRDAENARALLVVQPPRLPMPAEAAPLGVNPGQWKALVEAVWPSAKSVDGVILALQYCKSRNLDPYKRAVHIVPMWNSTLGREVETVWPGINEIRTTASRTGSHAGNDDCVFGPTVKRGFEASEQRGYGQNSKKVEARCDAFEFPEWAQVTVYRIVHGNRVPFVGPKVRFVEAFSGQKGLRVPNAKWIGSPWQMIEKCAEAAALRRAFPEELANDYTAEEMEGQVIHQELGEHTPVMDGGEAALVDDKRPTRESVAEEIDDKDPATWDPAVKADFDEVSTKIDMTEDPDVLKEAKRRVVERVGAYWPKAALDEIKTRFDTRIARMSGEIIEDDEPADDNSAGDKETINEEDNDHAKSS
jgi:phage recombination protein Bet